MGKYPCPYCDLEAWREEHNRWICTGCYQTQPKVLLVPDRISKFLKFRGNGLSFRQATVADMVRHGYKYKEIAHALRLTNFQVAEEAKSAMRVLGVLDRKELIRLWRNGES